MLVLSRKANENILFPGLGIEVTIQRIAGNSASVAIRAPKSVQILRGELAQHPLPSQLGAPPSTTDRELLHAIRNQLNKALLTVAIAQKRLEQIGTSDPEQTLSEMLDQLKEIDRQLKSPAVSETVREDKQATDPGHPTKTALVVEDDANERQLLAGYLRLCGFQTCEAADGVEALNQLDTVKADFVVLDMNMPRLDGRQTLEAIRRRPDLKRTRVFVVSGEEQEESQVAEDDCGYSEWFAKPLNTERFAASLRASQN